MRTSKVALVLQLALAILGSPWVVGAELPDLTRQGGDLSTSLAGRNAIQVAAPNTTSQERFQRQLSGFSVFHQIFSAEEGLGPRFVNSSCGGCHVQNGRGPSLVGTDRLGGSTMVIKVARRVPGGVEPIPGLSPQLLEHAVSGKRFFDVKLRWRKVRGQYPDGSRYVLRRPELTFKLPPKQSKHLAASLRMAPALIGLGLLEAVPAESILALADPQDVNADGVSGRANVVLNRRNNANALGRFGFKAAQPTVEQQSAAASFFDMGLGNVLFPNAEGTVEMTDDNLDRLVLYQLIPGVPLARDQLDPEVQRGKALFVKTKCDACHLLTLRTADSSVPELANQEFHPLTDLLLHDMGRDLSDGLAEGVAIGGEWRTAPLWALGFSQAISDVRPLFLHDGRARSVEEAILWHGGEGKASKDLFKALSKAERQALLKFLQSL